jgi:hypothetical protein
MKRFWQLCLLLCLAICITAELSFAQAPVGTISGTVSDETGAVIPNAEVIIKNKATGAERKLTSGDDGTFTAPALPAGEYDVTVSAKGFRTLRRAATVAVGAIVSADMRMLVGQAAEVVNVEAATAQINYEQHSIDGVITRQKIQELPLNGRSFLQLAFLEPGVTVSPGTTSQYNSLFSVSVLGGDSNKTNITVDGGNVRNSIEGNTGMNFSQEVVQEFQLSSVNFDLSTGITGVGSVNIVTRTGGNDFHGSGYFFFRDHNMAAYPGLARNPLAPDPFFARRNPGFWVSGPVIKDKLFFFFNYEFINQEQVFIVQPNVPSVAGLTGVYPSPYTGKTLSARFDYRLNTNNQIFLRYSHDGNRGFGPNGGAQPPSNWLQNKNWSDQSVLGWTTTLKPTLVNDFRFSYQYWQNRNLFPDNSVCPGCLGLNGPQLTLAGSNVTLGNTSNATQGRDLRRFQFNDAMTWQKGLHRVRFGGEWEYAPGTGFWGYCDPGCFAVATPELIRGSVPAALIPVLYPNVPQTIKTQADLNALPFIAGNGTVVGIGDPSQPPPYNVDQAKLNQRVRFFVQDSWRITPRFTLNYGLAWNFESTLVNKDLDKPKYLAPLYGNDLTPTNNNYNNWSPSVGFAWQPFKDNKTVVRGGVGIYYDTELLWRRLQERAFIGPLGNGRVQYPTTGFINTIPGVLNVSQGGVPIPVGSALTPGLTTMTLGQFINQIYNPQIAGITAALAPKNLNDLSVRTIDVNKSGAQLYPKDYPVQQSIHFNIGVQRELSRDFVLSIDYTRRVFNHTLLGEIDYNRFNRFVNGAQSPVIPRCTGTQASVPGFPCSTGPITFWTPAGRAVYNAMLVKLDKRFSKRYQFTASYALTNAFGYNGITNLDQWNSSWGPQQARHILNVSGIVELPWGLQLGIISSMASVGPTMPFVGSVDLNGDGTTSEPLPGLSFNCLNRGCGKSDLVAAVNNWNTNYAGKKDARGQVIQAVKLPSSYSFGRFFNSQDVRLTKQFTFRDRYKLSVFAEMFNVLNYANYSGFSFTLDPLASNPAQQGTAFGNPTQRAGQVFGSGGPRALQLGGRFQF